MTGTEKQVKWATEIINNAFKALDSLEYQATYYGKNTVTNEDYRGEWHAEYSQESINDMRETLAKVQGLTAARIIERRNFLTYDWMKDKLIAYTHSHKE